MKQITFIVVATFSILTITSCSKTDMLDNNVNEKTILTEEIMIFDEEMATFKNDQDYADFAKKFTNFSVKEEKLFLEKLPYTTFSRQIESLFDQFAQLKNVKEEESFLEANKMYLQKVLNKNGDQVIDVRDQSYHILNPIFNKDRILKIGDIYVKFIGEYAIESTDKSKLMKIQFVDDIKDTQLRSRKVVNQIPLTSAVTRELNQLEIWDFELKPSKCRNRRKVSFSVGIFLTLDNSIGTFFWHLESAVVARRQGWTCSWYKYRTEIDWQDIGFLYNRDDLTFAKNFGNGSCGSCMSLGIRELLWANPISAPQPQIDFKEVHSRVTTRGIGNNWLEIDKIY